MKLLAILMLLTLWLAPAGKCSDASKSGDPALMKYLQGDWSAFGDLNGAGVQKLIGLNFGSDGFVHITYYAASTLKEEKHKFSIDADGNILIDTFDETIRVQKFSENEFKFYRAGPESQKLREFEQTLFVYNFKRGT